MFKRRGSKLMLFVASVLAGFALIAAAANSGGPPDWDKSSLEFTAGCSGDCTQVQATVCNNGDGDMDGSVNWQLYYAASGNPKNGSVVTSGSLGPLDSGDCTILTYNPNGVSGNYMFRAEQRPGHPGTGELFSGQCTIVCTPPEASATPTNTPTDTPTATFTPTATDTEIPPEDTDTPTPTPTATPTATDTKIAPPDTDTPTPTATDTEVGPSPENSPTATVTKEGHEPTATGTRHRGGDGGPEAPSKTPTPVITCRQKGFALQVYVPQGQETKFLHIVMSDGEVWNAPLFASLKTGYHEYPAGVFVSSVTYEGRSGLLLRTDGNAQPLTASSCETLELVLTFPEEVPTAKPGGVSGGGGGGLEWIAGLLLLLVAGLTVARRIFFVKK